MLPAPTGWFSQTSQNEADKTTSGQDEADKTTSGQADKRTSGQDDKPTRRQADKRTRRQADRHGFCRVILVAICRCIRAIVFSVWAIVEIIVLFDYFFFGRHFFCLLIFDELENVK